MNIELVLGTADPEPGPLLDVARSCEGVVCDWRAEGAKRWRTLTLVVDERSTVLGHLEAALTIVGRELAVAA